MEELSDTSGLLVIAPVPRVARACEFVELERWCELAAIFVDQRQQGIRLRNLTKKKTDMSSSGRRVPNWNTVKYCGLVNPVSCRESTRALFVCKYLVSLRLSRHDCCIAVSQSYGHHHFCSQLIRLEFDHIEQIQITNFRGERGFSLWSPAGLGEPSAITIQTSCTAYRTTHRRTLDDDLAELRRRFHHIAIYVKHVGSA